MPPRIETRSLVTIDRLGAALERRNAHVTVGDRAATRPSSPATGFGDGGWQRMSRLTGRSGATPHAPATGPCSAPVVRAAVWCGACAKEPGAAPRKGEQ